MERNWPSFRQAAFILSACFCQELFTLPFLGLRFFLSRGRRRPADPGPAKLDNWVKLAVAVKAVYGDKYTQAGNYLQQLGRGELGRDVPLTALPWHNACDLPALVPGVAYQPHACVQAVLFPSVPLRTVWKRIPDLEKPGGRGRGRGKGDRGPAEAPSDSEP